VKVTLIFAPLGHGRLSVRFVIWPTLPDLFAEMNSELPANAKSLIGENGFCVLGALYHRLSADLAGATMAVEEVLPALQVLHDLQYELS
jgi:hypothetical protein